MTPRIGISNTAYKRQLAADHNEAYLRDRDDKEKRLAKAFSESHELVNQLPPSNMMQHLGMDGDIDISPDDLPDEVVMARPMPSRVRDQQAISRLKSDVVVIGGGGVTGIGRHVARSLALTAARDMISGMVHDKDKEDLHTNAVVPDDIQNKMKIGIFTGQGISTTQALADIARLKEKQ